MKAFIIAYERLSLLKNMARDLANAGLDIHIVDNCSTYSPLLEWYESNPYTILRMDNNYGNTVVWDKELFKLANGERYIVTDPDLDISDVPGDFITVLDNGLNLYPSAHKCGLSLRIDDLPNTGIGNGAREWEGKFWTNKLDDMYYGTQIDTTLAMYRENITYHTLTALRTAPPYMARHIPWYYIDFNSLPEDEKYYCSHCGGISYWSKFIKR